MARTEETVTLYRRRLSNDEWSSWRPLEHAPEDLDTTTGTGDIAEFIPAAVARELYEALRDAVVEAENDRLPSQRGIEESWRTALAHYESVTGQETE